MDRILGYLNVVALVMMPIVPWVVIGLAAYWIFR